MDTERASILSRIGDWVSGYPDVVGRRRLHHAPVALWRLGMGRLAGGALLLLTTTGRRTGLPRRTPLAAHRIGGRVYVWDPYGDRAHWFRNLLAQPTVTVQSGEGTWRAAAVRPSDEREVREVVEALRRFDDRLWARYLADGRARGAADPASPGRLHVARLDPVAMGGPPPLPADLAWLWILPLLGALGLAGRRLGRRRATGYTPAS